MIFPVEGILPTIAEADPCITMQTTVMVKGHRHYETRTTNAM